MGSFESLHMLLAFQSLVTQPTGHTFHSLAGSELDIFIVFLHRPSGGLVSNCVLLSDTQPLEA